MNLQKNQIPTYINLSSKKIENLHLFFEDWCTGTIENISVQISRFTNSIHEIFFLELLVGNIIKRYETIDIKKLNYAIYEFKPNDFKIWIKNFEFRYLFYTLTAFNYEEWQKIN